VYVKIRKTFPKVEDVSSMDQAHRLLMRLHLADGLGPSAVCQVLSFLARSGGLSEDFFTSPDFTASVIQELDFGQIYKMSLYDLVNQVGLTPQAAKLCLVALVDDALVDNEFSLLERTSIDYVTLLDDDFPELLRTISNPPPVLYVQGEPLGRHAKRLAVVGARAADDYAQAVLAAILPDIIANRWEIVSGGALGADAYAHEITLQAGGKTIVVLGAGLLSWGPKQNINLFERVIKQGGTIISGFPLETRADTFTFPIRNRIISGLSQGCLVVQAARKSGALITSQFALEQNRQIFAIPGSLFSPLSEGCHDLIAQGAGIVTSAQSILEALEGVGTVHVQQSLAFTQPAELSRANGHQYGTEREQVGHPVLACFDGAMSLDQLVTKSAKTPQQLNDLLFTLQLEGFVKQNFAGLWERL
jgi:DNA processing protein